MDGLALNVKGITWGGFDTSTFLADLNVVSQKMLPCWFWIVLRPQKSYH